MPYIPKARFKMHDYLCTDNRYLEVVRDASKTFVTVTC